MKKYTLLVFCICALLVSRAQTVQHDEKDGHNHSATPAQTGSETIDLQLKETEFDFSKIPQGKPVYHYFEIINTGKSPLKLDNVQASCGCTTPEWSKDPIPSGGNTRIKIGFNAATEGAFEKYITVYYNNSTQNKQIKIKGFVWKAPEGPAPSNPSIDLLKKQSF